MQVFLSSDGVQFQSTPPARGATPSAIQSPHLFLYFNPRPPRGGRRQVYRRCLVQVSLFQSTPPARGATTRPAVLQSPWKISIHAPREGGDAPCRFPACQTVCISIHAPREGGDHPVIIHRPPRHDFNPRPPRGGRLLPVIAPSMGTGFQSTPPARGATQVAVGLRAAPGFQSTPPARGATSKCRSNTWKKIYFNPRPPRGGRQQRCTVLPADL